MHHNKSQHIASTGLAFETTSLHNNRTWLIRSYKIKLNVDKLFRPVHTLLIINYSKLLPIRIRIIMEITNLSSFVVVKCTFMVI